MTKGRKTKVKVELKYSLLNEKFVSAIGERLLKRLRDAISNWKKNKEKQTEDELVEAYVQSLVAFWKKSKLKDLKNLDLKGDFDIIVDLIYKKGRKPNSIRLENNPALKEGLRNLIK